MSMQVKKSDRIALVGAGLVGSLLAIFMARRGFKIDMYERRPDMRKEAISAGRSINLAISTRGINALARLGIDDEVLSQAVPMRGRMMHSPQGELTFQPYGMNDKQCINSISRATLNKALMTHAEKDGHAQIFFNQRITGANFDTGEIFIEDHRSGQTRSEKYDRIIGTDGSASAIRNEMLKLPDYSCTESLLEYGYKELVVLPNADGSFKLERNALHIWPRGNFMLIALPNFEGSFTCTLFLPFKGAVSFEQLTDDAAVLAFFSKYFADAVPHIESLCETFSSNPTGHMVTVKTFPWNVGGHALLMGDAAHGIVPFYGQGMNCGFEDCTIFDQLLEEMEKANSELDWQLLFDRLGKMRKENTDAIADMAVENFVEMRDKVADARFLLEKAVEKVLQKYFPGRYLSRYALVTFSNIPYKVALDVGEVDNEILAELCDGLSDPEKVDLQLAEKLIDKKLAPLLVPYTGQLSLAASH
ncbi:MAG: FAD-dependent monooxygenase [Candidatus Obscuribacterales bacterium]|nr:FAD-dependent monooxygenase [Candidatus Obscuribacterales bacterium]